MKFIRTKNGIEKMSDEEAQAYEVSCMDCNTKKNNAICLINDNYEEYCKLGISFTIGEIEYIINNNKLTSDEIDKKYQNVVNDLDTNYDWTMYSPRYKLEFINKTKMLEFFSSIQGIFIRNEIKRRDKITDIINLDEAGLEGFIETPTYPTYERIAQ